MSEIKKEDTSAKEVIGEIPNIENTGSETFTETIADDTSDTVEVKIEVKTDPARKPDKTPAEIKAEIKKEEPKKKEPEVFSKKDRIYSNTPKIIMKNDSVEIDLEGSKREFDSSIGQIDAFKCAGKSFEFKFSKHGGKISGVKDEAEQEAVARSLVIMYETSTYSTE